MAPIAYETEWTVVLSEVIRSATSLLLNGVCILLAVQACYFLSRRRSSGRAALICAMIVACSFAIAQMIHQVVVTAMLLGLHHSAGIAETASDQQRLLGSFQHLVQVQSQRENILMLLNNLFVDSLFIYRCYVIWAEFRSRVKVICVPLLLVLAITILGIVTASLPSDHSGVNELTIVVAVGMITANLLLTGLTAGRIWWMRCQSLRVTGRTQLVSRYNTAIKMLLESSGLYFIFMVGFLIIQAMGSPATFYSPGISVLSGASGQLMNVLPALLILESSV
ncbi:hypothetical protein MVEN_00367100 [Mycena venus]|uniref:Uncharacterized protein n=1 Tax=Mycena venus TaxID=2733690 RepID=A0A8H7DAK1_9AGAR|nr:hypothetical protein MVEN_00367100 [Mycena venus]